MIRITKHENGGCLIYIKKATLIYLIWNTTFTIISDLLFVHTASDFVAAFASLF